MNTIKFDTKDFVMSEFASSWTYLTDKNGQPCWGVIEFFNSRVHCTSDESTFSLNLLIELKGFGKIMLQTNAITAHNQTVNLLDALIHGRIAQIQKELSKKTFNKKIVFDQKFQTIKGLKNSQKKLCKLLQLGEEIVLTNTKQDLKKRISRGETKSFLFGGQAFGIAKGEKFKRFHEENFDMGIAPFYFNFLKPNSKQETDWKLTDQIVDWLTKTKRPIKGHPLVWFHIAARPKWMSEMTFDEIKEFVKQHVSNVVTRYKDRIKMWDIINEVPTTDANSVDFTIDQLLEITKLVSDLVKTLQPDAERILNISDIFGPHSFVHDRPSIPPIHFLKLCQEKGIEYDSIGLQFYMGMKKEFACRELLNISQTIDDFTQFNKPIHFSELGWPSRHDVDPNCFFNADHPEVAGRWHKEWSEKLQAEFAQAIFAIFASKPLAKSITWWDLTDNGKNEDIGSRFIPFGGLTRRDFSPKPIVKTLQRFRQKIHRKN